MPHPTGEVKFRTSATNKNDVAVQFPETTNTGIGNRINKKIQTNLLYLKFENDHQVPNPLEQDTIVFEFYIINTFLTRFALKFIDRKSLSHPRALFIQWKFMNFDLRTPSFKSAEDIPIHFRYSCPITSPDLFFESIHDVDIEYVILNMDNDHQLVVGRGKIDFNELFRYPHNKIYANTQIWAVHSNPNTTMHDKLFASLLFWFQLNADYDTLDTFFAAKVCKGIRSDDSIFSLNARGNEISYDSKVVAVLEEARLQQPVKKSGDFLPGVTSVTPRKNSEVSRKVARYKKIAKGDPIPPSKLHVSTADDGESMNQIRTQGISTLDPRTSHLFDSKEYIEDIKPAAKPRNELRKSTIKEPQAQRYNSIGNTMCESFSLLGSQNSQKSEEVIGKHSQNLNTPTKSEIQLFDEAKDIVVTRNRVLATRQSDISTELHERTEWLFEEANWKRTLQEHAILNGQNPADINWRQWRNESAGAVIKPRKFTTTPGNTPKTLTITIHSLLLDKSSSVLLDPKVNQIYVEYSFLDYQGEQFETPISLPKPDRSHSIRPLIFDFSKQFIFDPTTNMEDCQKLAEKVLAKAKIQFLIISEPFSTDFEILDCEEIGNVEVDYYELVDVEEDIVCKDYPVKSLRGVGEDIGMLNISFLGTGLVRQIALHYLTPSGFKVSI